MPQTTSLRRTDVSPATAASQASGRRGRRPSAKCDHAHPNRLLRSLERAAGAVGALDQALGGHPLAPAWQFHQALAASVREARVDGYAVDQHRLAALVGGLRPVEVNADLSIKDRAHEATALYHALGLHTWHMASPDSSGSDRGGDLAAALAHLDGCDRTAPALLAAGVGLFDWLATDRGGRGPARSAVPHLLHRRGLTRRPLIGLSGAAALGVIHANSRGSAWLEAFVDSVGDEAVDGLDRLHRLERAWSAAQNALAARAALPGRRAVREGAAIARALDMIAAQPMIGPARLAGLLRLSVRQTGAICEELAQLAAVTELTGRRTRRLYGLETLAPVRLNTAGPRPIGRCLGRLSDVLAAPEATVGRAPLPAPARPVEYAVRLQPDDWNALMADTDRANARAEAALRPFLTASLTKVAATSARVQARLQLGTADSTEDPAPTDAIRPLLEDAA